MKKIILLAALCLYSTLGFSQWSQLPNAPKAQRVSSINNKLLLGTNTGVFESTDGGASWSQLSTVDANAASAYLNIIEAGSYWFLGSTTQGIYYSTDQGQSWIQDTAGMGNPEVKSMHFDGSRIFVATGHWSGNNFFYKDLGASTWSTPDSVEDRDTWGPLASDFLSFNNELYATTTRGMYKSTDNGKTWLKANVSASGDKMLVHNNQLYVYGGDQAVFRSSDGSNWTAIDSTSGLEPMDNWSGRIWWVGPMFSDGAYLYASQNALLDTSYIWRSADDGDTWSPISNATVKAGLTSFAMANNELFAVVKAPSAIVVKFSGTVHLEEEALANVRIYPNPASDKLQVETDTELELSLTNLSGQCLLQSRLLSSSELDVSHLSRGCYLLQLKRGNAHSFHKILLQ